MLAGDPLPHLQSPPADLAFPALDCGTITRKAPLVASEAPLDLSTGVDLLNLLPQSIDIGRLGPSACVIHGYDQEGDQQTCPCKHGRASGLSNQVRHNECVLGADGPYIVTMAACDECPVRWSSSKSCSSVVLLQHDGLHVQSWCGLTSPWAQSGSCVTGCRACR